MVGKMKQQGFMHKAAEVSAAHLQLLNFRHEKMERHHQPIFQGIQVDSMAFFLFRFSMIQLRSGLAVDDSQHVQDRW